MQKILLVENQGWKLYKLEKSFLVITPQGYEVIQDTPVEHHAIKLFNNHVERGWCWITVAYFIAYVKESDIVVKRRTKQIRSDEFDLFLKSETTYKTQDDTYNAIKIVYPKALEKYEQCAEALRKLEKDLGFESGFIYEGDTHGIHNEYPYISFKMDGFEFEFENRD